MTTTTVDTRSTSPAGETATTRTETAPAKRKRKIATDRVRGPTHAPSVVTGLVQRRRIEAIEIEMSAVTARNAVVMTAVTVTTVLGMTEEKRTAATGV